MFLYDFVHQPATSVNWPTGTENLGAFHGSEVPFVYGDTFELVGGEITLSESMSQFWTNMASSGDPNTWKGPTAPQWKPPLDSLPSRRIPTRTQDDGSGDGGDQHRRALQPAGNRPPDWVYWWHIEGATCEKGGPRGKACGADETGKEQQITACEKTCKADETCGGFEQVYTSKGTHSIYEATLKDVNCIKEFAQTGNPSDELFLLRGMRQPKPVPQAPNVEFPWTCSTFSRDQQCFNLTDTYKTIAINISDAFKPGANSGNNRYHGIPAPDLAKCCAACSTDNQCKTWFVPRESNGTECRLVYKDHVEGYKRPRNVCALPPPHLPMFTMCVC